GAATATAPAAATAAAGARLGPESRVAAPATAACGPRLDVGAPGTQAVIAGRTGRPVSGAGGTGGALAVASGSVEVGAIPASTTPIVAPFDAGSVLVGTSGAGMAGAGALAS